MSNKKIDTPNNLGERLRCYRKKKRLTGNALSNLIGISQGSLSDIENGKTTPSSKTLENLIRNTDLDVAWLLTGESSETGEKEKINPLLVDVNEWLNEEEKHKDAEFEILFRKQMIRAFFDYEAWRERKEGKNKSEADYPASKVA